MENVTTIIFMCILLAGFDASANFSGAWKGVGQLSERHYIPNGIHCHEMAFELQQTQSTLSLKQGYYRCGSYEIDFTPVNYGIRDSSLFLGIKLVGTISNNQVHLRYDQPRGQSVVIDILLGNDLKYHEVGASEYANWVLEGVLSANPVQ
jgi:hypothetical protein